MWRAVKIRKVIQENKSQEGTLQESQKLENFKEIFYIGKIVSGKITHGNLKHVKVLHKNTNSKKILFLENQNREIIFLKNQN